MHLTCNQAAGITEQFNVGSTLRSDKVSEFKDVLNAQLLLQQKIKNSEFAD